MKRFFLAALAIAAIASCAKNEVVSPENQSQEITFQTVVGPATKALDATQVKFDEDNRFYSYAFFLPEGKDWDTYYASAQKYITQSLIQDTNPTTDAYSWKNASATYYWPKQGSLTFFAWTDNTSNPTVSGSSTAILCENNTGIQVLNYSVTDNPNKDMMVAAVAKNKTANVNTYVTSGVPTLFSHILSNLTFKVKTTENYSTSASFALKSLTLKNVYVDGDYTQGSPSPSSTLWDNHTTTASLPVYTNATGFPVTSTSAENVLVPASGNYYIVIPQTFSNDTPTIEVVYTITTNYTGNPVEETVTVEEDLQTIYTEWEPGKRHELTISLSLSEILWDPATVDWVGETHNVTF